MVAASRTCSVLVPGLGLAVSSNRTGGSHKRAKMPCQDAVGVFSGAIAEMPFAILAVADGHGDVRHDLSHIGAALAIEASIAALQSLALTIASGGGQPEADAIARNHLPQQLVRGWVRRVADHHAGYDPAAMAESRQVPPELLLRYGSTLLAALVTPEATYALQIGDGDLITVDEQGAPQRLFPVPPGLMGTETFSLSSKDAIRQVRVQTVPAERARFLMLATDGISDSWPEVGRIDRFATELLDNIERYGLAKVLDALPQWLENFTEHGSGDDASLAYLLALPPAEPRPSKPPPGPRVATGRSAPAAASRGAMAEFEVNPRLVKPKAPP